MGLVRPRIAKGDGNLRFGPIFGRWNGAGAVGRPANHLNKRQIGPCSDLP